MSKAKTTRLSGNSKRQPGPTSASGSKMHTVGGRKHTWLTRNQGFAREKGKIGWVLLWLLGIPIPILVVLYFLRGCT